MKMMRMARGKLIYLLPALAAVTMILFGTPGVAPMVGWLTHSSDVLADVAARGASADPARRRCPECGVIASMREIAVSDPGARDRAGAGRRTAMPVKPARRYEFTVRLSDGSQRLITEANRTSWRIGERLTVIDGINPSQM